MAEKLIFHYERRKCQAKNENEIVDNLIQLCTHSHLTPSIKHNGMNFGQLHLMQICIALRLLHAFDMDIFVYGLDEKNDQFVKVIFIYNNNLKSPTGSTLCIWKKRTIFVISYGNFHGE